MKRSDDGKKGMMRKGGRYDTSQLIEAQFEPGSRGRVLRNKLGIKSKRQMDKLERQEQFRTLEELIGVYDENHCFTVYDVCNIHKIWLGNIYEWAGKYRQVNISKGDFNFAAAGQIPKLMAEFEEVSLQEFTPCNFDSLDHIVKALAIVHTELVLIHPFREGNGRVARLLSILMALQARIPPLDFSGIVGRKRQEYISAIHAGMDHNYFPMEKIFKSIIRRTLRICALK
jgi:cell filamentation protein